MGINEVGCFLSPTNKKYGTFREICIFFLLEILISICSIFINDTDILAILSLMVTLLTLVVCKYIESRVLSISTIFVILTFVFHCSQYIIDAFHTEYKAPWDVISATEVLAKDIRNKALIFYIISMLMLTFGLLLARMSKMTLGIGQVVITQSYCKKAGKMFVCLFILPRLYVDITWMKAYLANGYIGTFDTGISGILLTFADGVYIGIALLLIGYRSNKRMCRTMVLVASAYSVVAMMSGRRQEKVVQLLVIWFIYFHCVKTNNKSKIKKKNIIILSILAYFGITILASIGDMRLTGVFSINNFIYYFNQNLGFNMIFDQMMEFGSAGLTLGLSFKAFPDLHPFELGGTYLLSWSTILPKIGGCLSNIMDNLGYVQYIQTKWMYGLGGSYLGEAYYNFSWLGVFVSLVIGFVLGKTSNRIDNFNDSVVHIKSCYYLILLPHLFLWIRGSFAGIPRPFVWFSVVAYLISAMPHYYRANKSGI